MPKKRINQKANQEKEWPVVVYMWVAALAVVGYLVGETVFRTTKPHPFHWLLALGGGLLGIGAGWLWYRWRGDVL